MKFYFDIFVHQLYNKDNTKRRVPEHSQHLPKTFDGQIHTLKDVMDERTKMLKCSHIPIAKRCARIIIV